MATAQDSSDVSKDGVQKESAEHDDSGVSRPQGTQRGDPSAFITREQILHVRGLTTYLSLTNELETKWNDDQKQASCIRFEDLFWWHDRMKAVTTLSMRRHEVVACLRAKNNLTFVTPNPQRYDLPEPEEGARPS